jgi:CRISPR system Cascade subunit CasC
MTRFIQLHALTAYPPANLNRDDTGRPKTALLGDALRLRISSQSLKRAWRTSELFEQSIGADHLGTRTKRLGIELYQKLTAGGVGEKPARDWARAIAGQFGKLKADKKTDNDDDLQIEQLAHVSPTERVAADALAQACGRRAEAVDQAPQCRGHRHVRPHVGRRAGLQHRGRRPGRPRHHRAQGRRRRRLLQRR